MLVKLQAKIENDAGAEATRYKNNSYRYTTFIISYYIYIYIHTGCYIYIYTQVVLEKRPLNGCIHTHTRLTALFRNYPGGPVPER